MHIAELLATVIRIYSYVLVARIILSWFPNVDRTNPIIRFLYQVTEPVLEPVRRSIPPLGTIDISPIIVFLVLHVLQGFILRLAV